jgi:hypothetical protein
VKLGHRKIELGEEKSQFRQLGPIAKSILKDFERTHSLIQRVMIEASNDQKFE